jgi:hypothetical protein
MAKGDISPKPDPIPENIPDILSHTEPINPGFPLVSFFNKGLDGIGNVDMFLKLCYITKVTNTKQ